jgi:aspartate/methionine/tyrosine aminotransferase
VEVVDLTESNPTKAGFEYPADLLAPLASPEALTYDPQPLGLRSAREAVASDFARRGYEVSPERIALTASTSEAYALLFKLLCDPGDAVLVPRPSYPLFDHLTLLESIEPRPYRLEYHGTWRVDFDSVQRALDDRVKALLIVSPNNPTGSFLHPADRDGVAALCVSRDIALIGDEVFTDYPLQPPADRASVLDVTEGVVFSLGGLSKSAGLPQVKLGWMAVAGPDRKVDPVMQAYEMIADTYLSVSTPVQVAAPSLIVRGAEIRAQIASRVRRNLDALAAAAAAAPAVTLLPVEGGWSAVLRVPAYRSEEALVIELLVQDHVLVHPGFFFDFEHEAFVVVSLLVEPARFDAGVASVLGRAAAASVAQ